ncbi:MULTISPECIES: PTS lactose/cellobiose transporter subunit IIA [Planococcus]|uniref:PTS cellobiose transporter subunit IIA n=1 Tax=Planococcus kocurii TaxID=1374 RepID=A0ABM5WVQ5_9BACL|nr:MULTISPECIES: PTS lactose/cellobiose transporter subunit IIA [Planococcus]ALS78431.1 PTS cellobiose transporter subunit IIA [Planococcus kocurii]MDJ0331615.1 PTS lactose/cellobiose transporter subunit IIA [Planococcus sp. S3-L1]
MQTVEEIQMLSFTIILHAGNARSSSMEAIALAKNYKFDESRKKIAEAEEEFTIAHQQQTKLLQEEANGEVNLISVILVHAQDHLMTAITVKDLASEMIDMYEKMQMIEEAKK